jgi:hypothetical protein
MWQFNWGVFWAVLAATGIVAGVAVAIITGATEVLRKYLSGIETKIEQLKPRN